MQPEKETSSTSSPRFHSPEDSGTDIFHDVETDIVNRVNSNSREPSLKNSQHSRTLSFNIKDMDEKTPLLEGLSRPQDQNGQDVKFAPCCSDKYKSRLKSFKIIFLFLWCIICAGFFISKKETEKRYKLVSISRNASQDFPISSESEVITVRLEGPFYENTDDVSDPSSLDFVTIGIASSTESGFLSKPKPKNFSLDINSTKGECEETPVLKKYRFPMQGAGMTNESKYVLRLESPSQFYTAMSVVYFNETTTEDTQVAIGFTILIGVYILIIFELVHRTTAAMLGALSTLAVLTYLNKRPKLETVLMWIQWETLSLLFGMMILVAVFARSGFFDYVALKAYKVSKGHVWRLITLLCLFTGVVSAFLDNVTTILLLTPVTIRLCQVLNLEPTYVLIAEVIFSNIGGTATAIGDPPNVILVSHHRIMEANIGFSTFTEHLIIGIVFCMITGYIFIRLLYIPIQIENLDSPEVAELKREAEIWRRTADRVPISSTEEKTVKLLLLQKTLYLENTIRNMERHQTREQVFKDNLHELENKYKITDYPLLIKSGLIISVVVAFFFLQSFIKDLDFAIGWIAVIGAISLIVLADIQNIEEVMENVEWTTLVFFAGLFVLMQALEDLGLFTFLSNSTAKAIEKVDKDSRLTVAIIAILWISALASSFVDNIPFTTAMIPVVLQLHNKETVQLPLQPLVWALAMGACLGGNGTLIGASANVVCAGLSEQYGYPISFNKFTKIGFPMMLVTVGTATAYLYIYHIVLGRGNI